VRSRRLGVDASGVALLTETRVTVGLEHSRLAMAGGANQTAAATA
jgi:hypothetical protein